MTIYQCDNCDRFFSDNGEYIEAQVGEVIEVAAVYKLCDECEEESWEEED